MLPSRTELWLHKITGFFVINMFVRSKALNVFMITLILAVLVCQSFARETAMQKSNEEDISPNKNNIQIIILLVCLGVGLCAGLLFDFFNRSCPNCCKEWGLKSTGEKKRLNQGITGILRPTWLIQYKCKNCGYVVWKKHSPVG